MPVIRILSHHTFSWESIANVTYMSYVEYAEKHGYLLHMDVFPDYEKYNGLLKLRMMLDVLNEGDVGLIIDCDAIITNMNILIEDFLKDGKDWYMSDGLNAGVFIIRKTEMNEKIIQVMVEEISCGIYHCEQDAIESHSKHIPNFCIKSHPCFNSFIPELYGHIEHPEEITHEKGRWLPGDFICHVPALSIDQRIKVLSELKEKIVR